MDGAARALSTQLSTAALDKNPQSAQRGITLDLVSTHSGGIFCLNVSLLLWRAVLSPQEGCIVDVDSLIRLCVWLSQGFSSFTAPLPQHLVR